MTSGTMRSQAIPLKQFCRIHRKAHPRKHRQNFCFYGYSSISTPTQFSSHITFTMLTRYASPQSLNTLSIEPTDDVFLAEFHALFELLLARLQQSSDQDLNSIETLLQHYGHDLLAPRPPHPQRKERFIKLSVPLLMVCHNKEVFTFGLGGHFYRSIKLIHQFSQIR